MSHATRAGAPFSKSRPHPDASTALPLPSAVVKCSGNDVVKKSSRKLRHLLALPGVLSKLSGSGPCGTLSAMNTPHPVLTFDFPTGKLRLKGSIQYPANRYVTLQCPANGGTVACEDVYDCVVVFGDGVEWAGVDGAELPEAVAAAITPPQAAAPTPSPATGKRRTPGASRRAAAFGADGVDDDAASSGGGSAYKGPSLPATPTAADGGGESLPASQLRRGKRARRISYKLSSSEGDDSSGSGSDGHGGSDSVAAVGSSTESDDSGRGSGGDAGYIGSSASE